MRLQKTREKPLLGEEIRKYKSAEEFVKALKPEEMSLIIEMSPSEKLEIFKKETNIENLEAGLEALKQGRREYLEKVKKNMLKRNNELMRWNKELIEDAEYYLNELKTKATILKGANQSELDNFLKELKNKYASCIVDTSTFYKKLTPEQMDYLLLNLTEGGKYKPFLKETDFLTKKAFRQYEIKTDAIKNILFQKTGKYPQWDTFELQLTEFYNQAIKGKS